MGLWACGLSIFHDSDLKDLPRHAMWDLSLCIVTRRRGARLILLVYFVPYKLRVALEKLKPGRLEGNIGSNPKSVMAWSTNIFSDLATLV